MNQLVTKLMITEELLQVVSTRKSDLSEPRTKDKLNPAALPLISSLS